MAETSSDGVRLHWTSDGDPQAPALLFLNSLGTDLSMWDAVVAALSPEIRCLRMDTRGHGRSDVQGGDYSIASMARDARAVLDAAGVVRAAVCGLSMGGMTAMQLALDAPDRVDRVVVANSSAEVPAAPWRDRAALVRAKGMEAVADTVIERFFSAPFRRASPDRVAVAKAVLLGTDPGGYAASCMAIAGLDIIGRLPGLSQPLLVINGASDAATPPEGHGLRIAATVPGARSVTLEAGHLSAIENPEAFAVELRRFLGLPSDG